MKVSLKVSNLQVGQEKNEDKKDNKSFRAYPGSRLLFPRLFVSWASSLLYLQCFFIPLQSRRASIPDMTRKLYNFATVCLLIIFQIYFRWFEFRILKSCCEVELLCCRTIMICKSKVTHALECIIYSSPFSLLSSITAPHSETKVLFMQLKLATLLRSSLIGWDSPLNSGSMLQLKKDRS